MPRWEPDARDRMIRAALDLYSAKGYDQTTVGDIAARAGVTARTYHRHFVDKREVLFSSSHHLRERVVSSLRDAPSDTPPFAAALDALGRCDDLFDIREHDYLVLRETLIAGSPELQEREALKLATIAAEVGDVLEERGLDEQAATLMADLTVVIFKRASRLWMDGPETAYPVFVDRASKEVRAVVQAHEGALT